MMTELLLYDSDLWCGDPYGTTRVCKAVHGTFAEKKVLQGLYL